MDAKRAKGYTIGCTQSAGAAMSRLDFWLSSAPCYLEVAGEVPRWCCFNQP
jgi:hypothetical protein